ncbi:methyltransferase [soil metagenome]
MANNYFQFKQFTIYQDQCAMKVTSDACLFGAITAAKFIGETHLKILDIGTGTGLLSLMVAQKNTTSKIDAVEIDEAAALQVKKNVAESAFASQIEVYKSDIKQFDNNHSYDFIITNPPFFENDLKSIKDNRNKALHDASLTLDELLKQFDRLLKPGGLVSILLPYHRTDYFIAMASKLKWYCSKRINVKQTENHDYFRGILCFNKTESITEKTSLIIKQEGEYSNDFKQLLKDYYLHL